MENLVAVFVGEATELLKDLEKALLQLEDDKHDKVGISEVFRIMHSLKGSANMFGFDAINHLTHDLETIYQAIRDAGAELTSDIFNTTLLCLDHLTALLENPSLTDPRLKSMQERLLAEIRRHTHQIDQVSNNTQLREVTGEETTYYVSFHAGKDILKNGTNTLYLIDELVALGKGLAFANIAPGDWNTLVPESNLIGFEVVLCTKKCEQEIRDVFIFVDGDSEIEIIALGSHDLITEEIEASLTKAHCHDKKLGITRINEIIHLPIQRETNKKTGIPSKNTLNVRVPSQRLDELMNLVSELVTTQASLSLWAEKSNSAQLTAVAETIEKLTRRLRDNAFSMTLVPVENLVVRFQRLVRDLSKELGKEVSFTTIGTETEIDKSIVEKLVDPIMHLVRNSLDHGIETPGERLKKGKAQHGTIQFKAYYSGTNVLIELTDDGAGINLERVRQKAVEKGLIAIDAVLSEKEITNLIFLPGFSTSDIITEVSGRGVGMDVVRRNITDIRGEIDVTSVPGQGSSFTIRLPLTLSIIDGLLVKIAEQDFILPLSSVRKCYEIETSALAGHYNHWLTLDGERTPYLYLRSNFGIDSLPPSFSQVVKISTQLGQIGLVVDRVIGDYQAVLKPLGQLYNGQDEFSGATILGDGTVALVIDPTKLIQKLYPMRQHNGVEIQVL